MPVPAQSQVFGGQGGTEHLESGQQFLLEMLLTLRRSREEYRSKGEVITQNSREGETRSAGGWIFKTRHKTKRRVKHVFKR